MKDKEKIKLLRIEIYNREAKDFRMLMGQRTEEGLKDMLKNLEKRT